MRNLTMQRMLKTGKAIDLSDKPRTPEGWILLDEPLKMGQDYCLANTEEWVWWCVKHNDGRILAGTHREDLRSFGNSAVLIWLR